MDPLAIIDTAKPAEDTLPLCLRGDLVAQFQELDRQRQAEAEKPPVDSLAAGGRRREIAEAMEALREEMKASTVVFRVRAMPRKKFRELCDAHQPRLAVDGTIHRDDRALGVNQATFWDPLIRACLVEPVLDEPRLAKLLDEVLSDYQFEQLAGAAFAVNRSDVDIPFSSAAFRDLATSLDV